MNRQYVNIDLDNPAVPRDYSDALGRPLAVGDVIAFAASRGSSAALQFAIVDRFVDTDRPKHEKSEWDQSKDVCTTWRTWRRSWTLRLRYLEKHADGVLRLEKVWDNKEWRPALSLDEVKPNRVEKIENVVRIDDAIVELP